MKKVTVNASKSYDILIDENILQDLGNRILTIHKRCKVMIVSDSNVWPLWGEIAKKALTDSGFQVAHFVFPAGEQSKCADTYLRVLDFAAKEHLTRSDMMVALGGGVVGDLTGFAAATYLRGIPYIQVPTSLLAMVDSSVGGKTAIDLPAGKNLVGAFYQPSLVLCDLQVLKTLPDDVFRDGCAEVIKYAILYDNVLFNHLERNKLDFQREYVISRCVELKRDVVDQDEFDTGERQKLNLGHTLGHGVEACSGFTVSHGKAVAIGTCLIARSSAKMHICTPDLEERITELIRSFGLPITTNYPAESLLHYALSDKKRSGDTVNLILPRAIGDCIISPVPVNDLLTYIEV